MITTRGHAPSAQRFCGALLLAGLLLTEPGPTLAAGAPPRTRDYHIAGQPLEAALSQFAQESGVDILLNDSVAAGRRSSPVAGRYATPQALNLLLEGSGLLARFTSPQSAIVFPATQPPPEAETETGPRPALVLDMMRVSAPRLIGRPMDRRYEDYALGLATQIRRIVTDAKIPARERETTTRIRTRITREGALQDVHVLTASADRDRDARIVTLLEGQRLGIEPPADLPQPLIFEVRTR